MIYSSSNNDLSFLKIKFVFVKFIFALNQDDFFYTLSLEIVLSITAIGFPEL